MKVSEATGATILMGIVFAIFAAILLCSAGCVHIDRVLDKLPEIGKPSDPSTPAAMQDEIDLSAVAWHGPDIRGWPIASEMPQGAYVSGSMLHFPHTKAGQWAANKSGLEGNPWVIVRVGGQWRAATFEWLRKGQTSKPWEKVRADHIKVSAFGDYQLQRGEEFYVIVSGRARGAEIGTQERTAARKVVWR